MKDQAWLHHRLYLELFAGPGKCLIRESNREDLGSPLKVLEKNFTDFIFVEINEAAACALSQRIRGHPKASQVDIWCGDCAEAIRQITIPSKSLTLAFVDPTRISDAPFFLIETLSGRMRSDLLINIPIGTDIKRNMHNYVRHSDAAAPLTVYLGCDSWKQLPTNSPANFCRGLIQIYQSQLHKLGYTFFDNIQQVTTPRNLPLYYLLFASKHQLGGKFWNETLRRINAPELF
jgi:three-Cys-motif partner protein